MVLGEIAREVGRALVIRALSAVVRIWDLILTSIGEAIIKFKNWRVVDLKSPHHKKNNCSYVWCWILTRLIMAVSLLYVQIPNHYVIPLKLAHLSVLRFDVPMNFRGLLQFPLSMIFQHPEGR